LSCCHGSDQNMSALGRCANRERRSTRALPSQSARLELDGVDDLNALEAFVVVANRLQQFGDMVVVSDAVSNEAVAEQIVAMLVGSIGLLAAVPVTTALAALLAARISTERSAREQHLAHTH
jgi:hypothetical protein